MSEKMMYVVIGESGEYSDRREWLVCAYESEELARAHADAAKRWYDENDCFRRRDEMFDFKCGLSEKPPFVNPYDPDMYIDYTGTTWCVAAVPLRTALPASSNG